DLPLEMRGAPSDIRNLNSFLHTKTNAEGRFEFDDPMPPGDYLLGFRLLGTADGEVLPYARTYYPGVAFKGSVAINLLATFCSSDELAVVTTSCIVSEFLQQNPESSRLSAVGGGSLGPGGGSR